MEEPKVAENIKEEPLPEFPANRRRCLAGERPCPWLRCRHHMFWTIYNYNDRPNSKDSIRLADVILAGRESRSIVSEILRLKHSCTLDVQADGPHTLETVGECLRITRERVRQIESKAVRKLTHITRSQFLRDFWLDLSEEEVNGEIYANPGGSRRSGKRSS